MKTEKYVKITEPSEGVILNLKVTKSGFEGNGIEVAHWLNASMSVPTDGKAFITGEAGNDSFIAYDGDLILRHANGEVEVVSESDKETTDWVLDPR